MYVYYTCECVLYVCVREQSVHVEFKLKQLSRSLIKIVIHVDDMSVYKICKNELYFLVFNNILISFDFFLFLLVFSFFFFFYR